MADQIHNEFSGTAHTVLQIGTVHGDVNLTTGLPVRTRYREQVRRIAPLELQGRKAELAALAEFCTSPHTAGTYSCWRAEPWAGKSALMSWFVLHSPPGVRIVSFFVTARLASQSDRLAFSDNVLEQLATLLGAPIPPFLTDSTRDAHVLGMLNDAAESCLRRGEQFVLLVDGLDEDRGDPHSIAALLPIDPPAGMRIIVAGRPNPPIPPDVPEHHPLRDPGIVRDLSASPAARAVRFDMEQDLDRMLDGPQRDLLGFVAAAADGLTAADLADLTLSPAREVVKHLSAANARSFSRRKAVWHTGDEVYVLAHDELQATAVKYLGGELPGYRERLHAWASRYRDAGWPPETPEYLMLGYFRLLLADRNVATLIAFATDPVRDDRMFEQSGGDFAALAEITAAQGRLLSGSGYDLAASARLAMHREYRQNRNDIIPEGLPALWAALGQTGRAENLARSMTDLSRQATARAFLASALAGGGHLAQACEVVQGLDSLIESVLDPAKKRAALLSVARVLVEAGEFDHLGTFGEALLAAGLQPQLATLLVEKGEVGWAEALSRGATRVPEAAQHYMYLAQAVAKSGDLERASGHVASAEDLAGFLNTAEPERADALMRLAVAAAWGGDLNRAREYAAEAVPLVRSIADDNERDHATVLLVDTLCASGELEQAENLADTITEPSPKHQALLKVAEAVAGAGNLDHAEELVALIDDPEHRANALIAVAIAATSAGNRGCAKRVLGFALTSQVFSWTYLARHCPSLLTEEVDFAVELARNVYAARDRGAALIALIESADDPELSKALSTEAERSIRSIFVPHLRSEELVSLARALVWQLPDRARELGAEAMYTARSSWSVDQEITRLAALARGCAAAGNRELATTLANQAEAMVSSLGPHVGRDRLLIAITEAKIVSGALDSAKAITRSIADPGYQCDAMLLVIRALTSTGAFRRARRLIKEVKQIAARSGTPDRVLAELVTVLLLSRDLDRADQLTRSISDAEHRNPAVQQVVEAMLAAGYPGRAEDLARLSTSSEVRARLLIRIANSDPARAGRLTAEVESAAHALPSPLHRIWALMAISKESGPDRARQLVTEAEGMLKTIDEPSDQSWAVIALAGPMAAAGEPDRAEHLVMSVGHPYKRNAALRSLIEAVMAAGDHGRAERLAELFDDPHEQTDVWESLAERTDEPRATRLTAQLLQVVGWTRPLNAVARLQPNALKKISAEFLRLLDHAGHRR